MYVLKYYNSVKTKNFQLQQKNHLSNFGLGFSEVVYYKDFTSDKIEQKVF
jgi:hypothetical protein